MLWILMALEELIGIFPKGMILLNLADKQVDGFSIPARSFQIQQDLFYSYLS